ncbi:hypothetical protein LXM63_18685 [Chryseobacterium gleum]|uniref:hypothetical protein n=1 Tax=Chryseobacterium gleum TaxID=250 RepID=UPI001E4F5314|nr:hypothetical protein [Chryseobacterium gleum]MCE4067134.1 hypothetical protein [Chryseobacterium gleum]
MSPYAYTWNDPVNYTDPTGMMGERIGEPGGPNVNKIYDGGVIEEVLIKGHKRAKEVDRNDPPGNMVSRFREKTSNWVQKNIRGPLSGWFDTHTRNAFVLDAKGQARMDDLRGQMSGYMRNNVGGGIRWGAEHGLIGSGMGTGHVGKFIGPKEAMRKKIADFAEKAEIYSGGQPSLAKNSEEIIEGYYRQMKDGIFKKPGAGFTTLDGKTVLTEGNHSMNAAIRYAIETGDIKYIKIILKGVDKTKVDLKTYGIPIRKFHTK